MKFNDGESFSAPGFIRVNFACPRAYLEEAFDKVSQNESDHHQKTGKSLLKVWAAVGRQNGVFYEDNKS